MAKTCTPTGNNVALAAWIALGRGRERVVTCDVCICLIRFCLSLFIQLKSAMKIGEKPFWLESQGKAVTSTGRSCMRELLSGWARGLVLPWIYKRPRDGYEVVAYWTSNRHHGDTLFHEGSAGGSPTYAGPISCPGGIVIPGGVGKRK